MCFRSCLDHNVMPNICRHLHLLHFYFLFFTQIYLTVIVSKTYSFAQKANKINDYESL